MKIYTITCVIAVDFNEEIDTKVFADKETAQAEFDRQRNDSRKCDNRDGWHIESDEDNYYESYTDGSYAENHCVIKLEEHEV